MELEIIPDVITSTHGNNAAAAKYNGYDDTNDDVAIVIGRCGGLGRGDGHFIRHDFSPFGK